MKVPFINLVVFFLSTATLGLTYKGILTFIPVYMGQNVHLGFLNMDAVAIGGTFTTISLFSGAVGQYLGGRTADRYPLEILYLIACIAGTIFVFIMAMSTNLVLIASAVLFAFFHFATQPIQNYILARYMPEHRRGLGYGIQFFLTFGVGSTAAAVSGYLADHFGLASVFYAMGLCFGASILLAGFLVARAPK